MRKLLTVADREANFWNQVAEEGDCWIWLGSQTRDAYGLAGSTLGRRGVTPLAHRVAYILMVAEIPDGLVLDHLCGVPLCVNPYHLEPVTQAENIRRSHALHRRTACKKGHPYTPDNTRRRPDRPGSQVCRTCENASQRRYLARKKAGIS